MPGEMEREGKKPEIPMPRSYLIHSDGGMIAISEFFERA